VQKNRRELPREFTQVPRVAGSAVFGFNEHATLLNSFLNFTTKNCFTCIYSQGTVVQNNIAQDGC